MLKNLNELNKDEKIELLKSIASGEVSRESIQNAIFITGKDDAFLALMVLVSSRESGEDDIIIGLGEGKIALEKQNKAFEKIMEKRLEE